MNLLLALVYFTDKHFLLLYFTGKHLPHSAWHLFPAVIRQKPHKQNVNLEIAGLPWFLTLLFTFFETIKKEKKAPQYYHNFYHQTQTRKWQNACQCHLFLKVRTEKWVQYTVPSKIKMSNVHCSISELVKKIALEDSNN